MRRKRRKNKSIMIISAMMIMCIIAGIYILKLAGDMSERRQEEAASEEAAAQEAESVQEEESKEAAAKKSEHIYAYRAGSNDNLYTMAAYENAAAAGAGAIVLPFVVSQEGSMYVADDDYAEGLTGYGGYFSGMTDAQIDNLEMRGGGKMLKLDDVFDKFGKDINYVIELKYTGERNLEALKDIISGNENGELVSVSSRYFSGLRSLEGSIPDTPKIFLCSDENELGEALGLDYIDVISLSKELMDEENCKKVHDAGKLLGVWTMNTEEEIQSAIDLGADVYFTDEGELAMSLEEGRQN